MSILLTQIDLGGVVFGGGLKGSRVDLEGMGSKCDLGALYKIPK